MCITGAVVSVTAHPIHPYCLMCITVAVVSVTATPIHPYCLMCISMAVVSVTATPIHPYCLMCISGAVIGVLVILSILIVILIGLTWAYCRQRHTYTSVVMCDEP